MAELDVEVLVIGWGKAGKTLAGALGRAGRRVALVEQSSQMYGGTCINIACVPTKALIHHAEHRPAAASPRAWFADSVKLRDSLTERLRSRNHELLAEVDTVTLVDGRARFADAHTVAVTAGEDRLDVHAETIVVNTGSLPAVPPIPGAATSSRVHDSTTLQHVDPLPDRLVIIGGGYIGLEFAGMFARFGSAVTVVDQSDALLPAEDRDVADGVRERLEELGVRFIVGAGVSQLSDTPSAVSVALDGGGSVEADAVLVATGRRPATGDLGLEHAGIATDARGFIEVDEHLRTSVPHVFAVGDVNGGPQFTYVSLDDHRIVLDQLVGDGRRTTGDRVAVPTTTFLTPPLSRVGVNELQARAEGLDVLVAGKWVTDIAAMPRPKIVGETHGLVKLVVDRRSDLVLGATLWCVDSQELINVVALAMRAGVTSSQLRDGIWTHPSSTEALNEVLGSLRPLA